MQEARYAFTGERVPSGPQWGNSVKKRPRILYISYDGMLEPLGQSQVIAYLRKLSGDNDIHLLSYEKTADWLQREEVKEMRAMLAQASIVWHPFRYHKRPSALATAWDILVGSLAAVFICIRHRI